MGYSNTTLTPSHQTKKTQNNTLKTPSHHKRNINTITSQKKHQTLHSHNNTIFDQALLPHSIRMVNTKLRACGATVV